MRPTPRTRLSSIVRLLAAPMIASALALLLSPGCGSGDGGDNDVAKNGDGGHDDLFGKSDAGPKGPCQGLECRVESCANGGSTTVSGTVFAPNGTLPLYNVVVYVPNAPLDPIPEGPSCDRCGNVSGSPIASTITDTNGNFTLSGVPSGADVPLVIQVGKWRREIVIPQVAGCTENPISDKNLTRLPRNRTEGHIPKIAVTTGRCDHLACLLPKLGLDASEYSPTTGDGRLHLYRGARHDGNDAPAPDGTPPAIDLWGSLDGLKKYDMMIFSCECGEHAENKPDAAKTALYEYAKLGGRVFTSHFHYEWFWNAPVPVLQDLADWVGNGNASGGEDPPFLVDTTFPKGAALAEWLVNVAASTTMGRIPINQPRGSVVGVTPGMATRWVYNQPNGSPETTKYLTFNAPVDAPAENQCGKVVFGDMHVTGTNRNTDLPDNGFPGTCGTELTPEEKALIFLFFDLASCVQKEDAAPVPPIR